MILNPIMYSNGAKPEPVKPETCGTVSLDPRIQLGAEMLFSSGRGWFEPNGPFTHKPAGPLYLPWFETTDMKSSSGKPIPTGMKYPWEAPFYISKSGYGTPDITFFFVAPDYQGFSEGGGPNPPYIVRVSKDQFDLSGPRMYFHNLAFEDFVGKQCMAAIAAMLVGIDLNDLYEEYPIVICSMTDTDGLTVSQPLDATVVDGKLAVTLPSDIIDWAYEHIGMRGFTEWHVGHIG